MHACTYTRAESEIVDTAALFNCQIMSLFYWFVIIFLTSFYSEHEHNDYIRPHDIVFADDKLWIALASTTITLNLGLGSVLSCGTSS